MSASTETWAIRYIKKYGLALVPIPPGHKAPLHQGWNQPGGYVTDIGEARQRWSDLPDHGIGAVLGPSGLCSLDMDAPDHALPALGELGIDLGALREATPTIQGDPPRYRLMFRAPGVALRRKVLTWPARQPGEKPLTLFELRAGDIQDVLPPTVHPDTGKSYIWLTLPNSEFPLLPEPLLELWQHWDSYRKELEAMCPWGKHGFNPEPAPRGDGARPDVIAAFNRARPVEELLADHGYTRRGKRWISPTSSSGLAGVVVLDDGRVYSHHASDPLAGDHAHDAFDLFRILDHGGDPRAAFKAAAEDLGMGSAAGTNQDKNEQSGAGTDQAKTKADDSGIVVLEISELLIREFPAKASILSPWLRRQDLIMIYSKRGVGKTHLCLALAYAVASGEKFLKWEAPQSRRVLYIDGEMPGVAIQERLAALVDANEKEPPEGFFRIVTPDAQSCSLPDLATVAGQSEIDSLIGDAELIVLDNLSTLMRSGVENEGESWIPMATWALAQRRKGRSVMFVHHAGKGGQQRGSSRREDLLDVVICLKHPSDYTPDQGARFEMVFEKARGLFGADVATVEAALQEGANHKTSWTWKAAEGATVDRILELKELGMSPAEIAVELGVHRSTVYRAIKGRPGGGT